MPQDDDAVLDAIAVETGDKPVPAITFELGGRTFTALPDRPMGALMQLHAKPKPGEPFTVFDAYYMLSRVVYYWTVPEQRDDIEAVFEGLYDLTVINDKIEELTTKALTLPFVRPSSSAA